MKRKETWSYNTLLKVFDSDKTNQTKFFEYFLYSISDVSFLENIMCDNSIEGAFVPYDLYSSILINSLEDAHKGLSEYLQEPLNVVDYDNIVRHIRDIQFVQKEIASCGWNLRLKWKLNKQLKKMLMQRLTIKQVLNYFSTLSGRN